MRILSLLRREAQVGPRSTLLLWSIVLPVLITVLVRGVFGDLFQPQPRLGVVDLGDSAITTQVRQLDGIEVTILDSVDELKRMVESNDLDAGLVLRPGFDDAVRSGLQPKLEFYISGESLASNRIILEVTAIDLIREVAGEPAPVDVNVVSLGEEGYDLVTRLLPFIVIYAVVMGGSFIPAMSLVQERENRTLEAVLATPATIGEVLTAKGVFGFILAILTGAMTLWLNHAWGQHPMAMLAALALAGVMMAEIGLLLGSISSDSNVLFAIFKTLGIFIIFPVIFPIFPSLPQWIAKLGPTYYFLQPVFEIAVNGAGLADVWVDLAIGAAICVVLVPLVARLGRRMATTVAIRG